MLAKDSFISKFEYLFIVALFNMQLLIMKLRSSKKIVFIFACQVFLLFFIKNTEAQKIEYSSENVFSDYPDKMQLVSNISGNHHLIKFIEKEQPVIFIFDNDLEYKGKINLPVKFPEKAELRIIAFDKFYYLYLHPRLSNKYFFYKIAGNGEIIDMSIAFQELLRSQSHYIKLGFQLIANQVMGDKTELCMIFHTSLADIEKNTIVIVQTDSTLRAVFSHKVKYDFNRDEEKLQQEILVGGKSLVVLKTARSGTSLEVMKVNLGTGYTIRNTFHSSGFFYSQATINYSNSDSSITVSAVLTEPRYSSKPKRFVFVSRLNKILIEQTPFAVLKSQFLKNTNTNFLLINGISKWIRLRPDRDQSYYTVYENTPSAYQDLTMADPNNPNTQDLNRLMSSLTAVRRNTYTDEAGPGIRFSLLDKNLKIASDSLVPNNKNSYSILPDRFARFNVNNKEYMLVGQRFYRKNNGLLMIRNNEENQLQFTDVRVNDRYDYLLSQSQVIPQKGIIIPYTRRREAGLVKITIQ